MFFHLVEYQAYRYAFMSEVCITWLIILDVAIIPLQYLFYFTFSQTDSYLDSIEQYKFPASVAI
jgi:uncharacterized membrane protein